MSSADGSRVFMSTVSHGLTDDSEDSSDIYEARRRRRCNSGLITTKGGVPSNDDSCLSPGVPYSLKRRRGRKMRRLLSLAGPASPLRKVPSTSSARSLMAAKA